MIRFVKTEEKAITPSKAHPTDTGYDLTAISVYKRVSDRVTLYETGIAIAPPTGYYTEIAPRSSISKTGYMLANSIGIIDPDYRGSLKIALMKVDEEAPDLELPFTKCQLILKKLEPANMVEVESLDDTVRGMGGFGSTDNK